MQITKEELARALKEWADESKGKQWPDRSDDARHADTAGYLLQKIEGYREMASSPG